MQNPPTTLYSFALSPYSVKVRSYLLYKRVPFCDVVVNPLTIRFELPLGTTVPVLVHHGVARNESQSIGIWMDELFPSSPLLPSERREEILKLDDWVTEKLIGTWFRVSLGHDDCAGVLLARRWEISRVLDLTSPNPVPAWFRVAHAAFAHLIPFVWRAIRKTDLEVPIDQWLGHMAGEFEDKLQGQDFLGGSASPTMADLSAFPQIIMPVLRGKPDLLLPGKAVAEWVERMKSAVPNYRELLPAVVLSPAANTAVPSPPKTRLAIDCGRLP